MQISDVFTEYLEHLFAGKRSEARETVFSALDRGLAADKILLGVVWPAMEQVEKLHREDHIPTLTASMAMRINRMIADQVHAFLPREPKTGRRMVVVCGDGETSELGAQITGDLFEAAGWSVWFLGAGVPSDEILQFVGKAKADVLTVYGTNPAGVPGVRRLVDMIRDVGACDMMQILVTGGVFNRAEGLNEEVRADLFAPNPKEALRQIAERPVRIPQPDMPQPGRRRKRRRRRIQPGPAGIHRSRMSL